MEEGSLRADLNISVRKKGTTKFGTKVEVKNMNSFRNVQKAIDFEIIRQIDLIEGGTPIFQETRTFDAVKNCTIGSAYQRRCTRLPLLPGARLGARDRPTVVRLRKSARPCPHCRMSCSRKYTAELGLSEYDAFVLTDSKAFALYFEEVIKHTIELQRGDQPAHRPCEIVAQRAER